MTVSLTFRDEKGVNLTPAEVDANFRALATAVNDFVAPAGVGIITMTVTGNLLTVHLSDGSTLGPFQLPVAALHWSGNLVAGHTYNELDLFQVPGNGVYLVLRAGYTAPDATTEGDIPFDATASDTEGLLLQLMFGTPTSAPIPVLNVSEDVVFGSEHFGAYIRVDSPTDITVFVSNDIGIGDGQITTFRQVGAGQIIFAEDSNTDGPLVTITTPETLKTRKAGSTATIIYVGGEVYDLAGDLELA